MHSLRLLCCALVIWRAVALGGLVRKESPASEHPEQGSLFIQSETGDDAGTFVSDSCHDSSVTPRAPVVCQDYRAPWSDSDLRRAVPEFAKIYSQKPIAQNRGGVGVNHAFALWFSVKWTRPTHIIESGVFKGQTTWILRHAAPDAHIFSLDPADQSQLLFKDNSSKTRYFMGKSFSDISEMAWDDLIPRKNRATTFVMLDDHQASVKRVMQLLTHGFVHLWYDDNWRKDCYSFNMVCSKPEGSAGVPYKDQFGKFSKMISMSEHNQFVDYLKSHLEVYFEFPAVWDHCLERPYYKSLLSKDEAERLQGLPQSDGYYATLYPPYVKLKVEGLPPPGLPKF